MFGEDINNHTLNTGQVYITGLRGLRVLNFILLVFVWQYNGLFVSFGRLIFPSVPALLQTIVFFTLVITLITPVPRNISWWGKFLEKSPVVVLTILFVLYALLYRFGGFSAIDTTWMFVLFVAFGIVMIGAFAKEHFLIGAIFLILSVVIIALNMTEKTSLASLFFGSQIHLITVASEALLAGQNPFSCYEAPVSGCLNYLPALWLPYVPIIHLELDPRWLNILSIPVIVSLILGVVKSLKLDRTGVLLAVVAATALLMNPAFVHGLVNNQVAPYWIYLLILMVGLVFSSPFFALLGLALAAAARQTMLVVLPITLWFFWKNKRLRVWQYFTAGLISFLILVPFFVRDPNAFINGTIAFNQGWALDRWQHDQVQATMISLSGPFFVWGQQRFLQIIQLLLVFGLTLFWIIRSRNRGSSTQILAITTIFFCFLLFNPIIWAYYWIVILLLLLLYTVVILARDPYSEILEIAGID